MAGKPSRELYDQRRRSGLCVEPRCGVQTTEGRARCPSCALKMRRKDAEQAKRHASLKLNLERNYKS